MSTAADNLERSLDRLESLSGAELAAMLFGSPESEDDGSSEELDESGVAREPGFGRSARVNRILRAIR